MSNMFGENLKQVRERRGLSQAQLANILNTSKQVISRYETGQRSPKVNVVAEYASALNIPITDLTGYVEKPATINDDGLTEGQREAISKIKRITDPSLQQRVLGYLDSLDNQDKD